MGVGPDAHDEVSAALLEAMNTLAPRTAAQRSLAERGVWDEAKHPRNPKGTPGGGKFKSLAQRITEHLQGFLTGDSQGDPFEGFSREQLRKVAKARGHNLPRGASRDHIAALLLDDLKANHHAAGHSSAAPHAPAVNAPSAAAIKKAEPSKPKAHLTGKDALIAAPLEFGAGEFVRGAHGDLKHELDPDSLEEYRGSGYEDINAYLRAIGAGEHPDDIDPDGDFKQTVSAIDLAMRHSKLTQPVAVHRGVMGLETMLPGIDTKSSLVGLEYVEDAFASTTVDRRVADGFGGAGVVLNIAAPKGVGAIQLSKFYDGAMRGGTPVANQNAKSISNVIHEPDFEAELLLQRGLRYRVVGDRTVNGVRELDIEVVHP